MMSEQRYKLEENNQTNELILWEDVKILNVFKSSYDNRKHLSIIVDKLNELNDERMMYKTTIDKRIVELEEENEQLKEERNYFERKKCEYFNKYNKKHLDNIQLKEENERLRTQLMLCQQYKNGIFRVWEVPPITIGKTISFSTNGDKNE